MMCEIGPSYDSSQELIKSRRMPGYKILVERRQKILEAIQEKRFGLLTREQKRALLALYFDETCFPTQASIARELGCSRANVNAKERTALERLGIIEGKRRLKCAEITMLVESSQADEAGEVAALIE